MTTRQRARRPDPDPAMLDVPTASRFTHLDGIAIATLSGKPANIQQALAAITRILASAAEAGIPRLVIDGIGVHGVPPPSLSDRHAMVREWAAAADGRVIVAFVCSPEFIDAERFGIVVGLNFGLRSNVFANAHDALAWLRLH
jgi:hypothetical protein